MCTPPHVLVSDVNDNADDSRVLNVRMATRMATVVVGLLLFEFLSVDAMKTQGRMDCCYPFGRMVLQVLFCNPEVDDVSFCYRLTCVSISLVKRTPPREDG
jgi:hypothetical protein